MHFNCISYSSVLNAGLGNKDLKEGGLNLPHTVCAGRRHKLFKMAQYGNFIRLLLKPMLL